MPDKEISEQQEIAKEILRSLEIICPHAILAGGAPRDWYLGDKANDLDFYFNLDPDSTYTKNKEQLGKVLPSGMELKKKYKPNTNHMYKHMKALRRIWYYEYKGMEVQLIQLHRLRDVYKVVDNMSCSICKAWWKGQSVLLHNDFKLTLATKAMFLNKGYVWTDMHPAKMLKRFQGKYRISEKDKLEEVAEVTL